jgi:arginine:ornithine antiporter/lysine permease
MILRGIKEAAFINKVVTVAKILPIFVFIGIEGASVYSRYAKRREDVGWATVTGFVGVLGLLVLVTMLPYGIMERAELAGLRQPSMAGVLGAVVGPWGIWFVSIGLIVSVLGAYLAWSMLAAEVLYSAARSELVPKTLARENVNRVPVAALWLTNSLVQAFLIVTLFAQDAFDLALDMTSAKTLIPYVLVAGYALKLAITRETYASDGARRNTDLIWAAIATLYTIFMLVAGGLKFVLLSFIIFAPGTVLFIVARREQGRRIFTPTERGLFVIVLAGAAYGIYALATGIISI